MKIKFKKFIFLVAFLSLSLSWPLSATGIKEDEKASETMEAKIDRLFGYINNPASPGAAVAVVKDGLVVYRKGFGSANLEYNIPITPSTVFHVASVSKQFTAMAISMLEAEGKLSVGDDIRKYLPDLPDFGKTITIDHLLHHTSGLRDQWDLLVMAGRRMDDVLTQEQILELVKRQKELNFTPGERQLYCNTGYTLLAEIVAKVSGTPFVQWEKDHIFNPLGMCSSHFHIDHEMIVKNRAYSYKMDQQKGFLKSELNYANVGATSLFTTVEDMANWLRNFEEKRIGGTQVIDRMTTEGVLNNGQKIPYARGLAIGNYKGFKTISHSGGDAGYRSHMLYLPELKLGIVILSNLNTYDPGAMTLKIAELYFIDKIKEGPVEKSPIPEPIKETKLKKKQLLAPTGIYWFEKSRLVRQIVQENDKLYYVRSDKSRSQIVPLTETEFRMLDVPDKLILRFSDSDQEQFHSVSLFIGNEPPLFGKRVKASILSAEELRAYTGTYYSEELDVTYRLSLLDGKLVVIFKNSPKTPLLPLIEDFFSAGDYTIAFTRDGNANLSGFKISTNRVLDLKFTKLK